MPACSIWGCKNTRIKMRRLGKRMGFFSFPKDEKMRNIWLERCRRKDPFKIESAKVCALHFLPDDFKDSIKANIMQIHPKLLKSTAIPSQYLTTEDILTHEAVINSPLVANLSNEIGENDIQIDDLSELNLLELVDENIVKSIMELDDGSRKSNKENKAPETTQDNATPQNLKSTK